MGTDTTGLNRKGRRIVLSVGNRRSKKMPVPFSARSVWKGAFCERKETPFATEGVSSGLNGARKDACPLFLAALGAMGKISLGPARLSADKLLDQYGLSRQMNRLKLVLLSFAVAMSVSTARARFSKGDVVVLSRDEPIFFENKFVRLGSVGETFSVLSHDQSSHKVYLLSQNPSGEQIAVNVLDAALVSKPASEAQQPNDPVADSWARVAKQFPSVGTKGASTYDFLQAQIEEIQRTDPSFFNQQNWPEVLAFRYVKQLTAMRDSAVATKSVPPESSISETTGKPYRDMFIREPAGGKDNALTIDNGTAHYAIIKFTNVHTLKMDFAIGICAGHKQRFTGLPEGEFQVVFALGDEVYTTGVERFSSVVACAKFDQLITFATQTVSEASITLQPVTGGNARTSTISREEFDKW